MTVAALKTRQGLVQVWIAQIVGTLVLAAAVYLFTSHGAFKLGTMDADWRRYALYAMLAAALPAVLYLRHYKRLLLQDVQLERTRGAPHAEARTVLAKAVALGGALCELPMAIGVVQLLFGGDMRTFLGATMVTIALRLSYRPFLKA